MEPLFPRNDQLQSRSSRRADSRLDEVNNFNGLTWERRVQFTFIVLPLWSYGFMTKVHGENGVVRKTESSEGQVINQPLRKALNV